MKLSSKAKIFTDVKEAKEYLEINFTFAKIDTKEYKKIHKTIQNIQTLFNIKNYIDSSILEENINKTNEINKKYEEAFYEYLKYKLIIYLFLYGGWQSQVWKTVNCKNC